jgi:hypothetical protein
VVQVRKEERKKVMETGWYCILIRDAGILYK